MLKEHVTMKVLEILARKNTRAKEKVTELENKFHALVVALQKVN